MIPGQSPPFFLTVRHFFDRWCRNSYDWYVVRFFYCLLILTLCEILRLLSLELLDCYPCGILPFFWFWHCAIFLNSELEIRWTNSWSESFLFVDFEIVWKYLGGELGFGLIYTWWESSFFRSWPCEIFWPVRLEFVSLILGQNLPFPFQFRLCVKFFNW